MGFWVGGNILWANYALQQKATLPPPEDYLIQIASQVALNPHQFNVMSVIEKQIVPDISSVFSLGFGSYSHQGAYLKYAPIPDWRGQPAFAILTGMLHTRSAKRNREDLQTPSEFTFRFAPIVSKSLLDKEGTHTWSLYLSSPFNYKLNRKKNQMAWQLIGGIEIPAPVIHPHVHVGWELGLNLSSSFNYLSVFLGFPIH